MGKIKFNDAEQEVVSQVVTEENVVTEQVVTDKVTSKKFKDKRVVKELVEKNTQFSKNFKLNDGTVKSVFSSSPLNYFDKESNSWKELDTSIKEENGYYVSNLGKCKAKMQKSGDTVGVSVGNEEYNVEWKFLGTIKEQKSYMQKTKGKMRLNIDKLEQEELVKYGTLKYEECDDGVDIEYITQGNGIKENIIVNKKSEEYKYYFSLKASGLKVKIDEQGDNILFYTEKDGVEQVELTIPAPYMYDSKKAYSNEVSFELEKVKEGEYIFIVEADANWINNEERVLPITIDPQINLVMNNGISVISKWGYLSSYNSSGINGLTYD